MPARLLAALLIGLALLCWERLSWSWRDNVVSRSVDRPGAAAGCRRGARRGPPSCRSAFNTPDGINVDWGYVVVPEDRANPDGPGIRLPVVIFRSVSETPAPDPVVLLVGGPGQALEYPDYTFRSGYAEFLKTRDFILNEQRAMRGLYALCERWGAPAAAPYEDEAVIGRPAGDDVRDALMDKPIRLWLILSGQWAEAHCLILLMY